MEVVYAREPLPDRWRKSIFLAGPTPRDESVESWRPRAIDVLDSFGYNGVVFVPEDRSGGFQGGYPDQPEWERMCLDCADTIVLWVPRDLETMPAFTTNVEFGRYVDSGRLLYGRPDDAPKNRYLDWLYKAHNPHDRVYNALDEVLLDASMGGSLEYRTGGERKVPVNVWQTAQFQVWYRAQRDAGNRLDDAKVLWTFRIPNGTTFAWALWVKVWVAKEERHKENEFVLSRPDISTVLLYKTFAPDNRLERFTAQEYRDTLMSTEVVLIREFRSPARTLDGCIHELPGGSSLFMNKDPRQLAIEEVKEETGLELPPQRFKLCWARQVAGTLSAHKSHFYTAELTGAEMEQVREAVREAKHFGVEGDSERTYLEVWTLRDLLHTELIDWSTLGMITQGLLVPIAQAG